MTSFKSNVNSHLKSNITKSLDLPATYLFDWIVILYQLIGGGQDGGVDGHCVHLPLWPYQHYN